jgi:transposase
MTYIAIDVHKSSSTFAYLDPATGELGKRNVHTTRQRYESVLSGLPKPWVVAVEATRQSPAVCAWLREMDADVHLVDPQTLSMLGKLRLAKTDLKDAELMLHALVHDYLPEAYLAPEEVVERRALSRGHVMLREMATQLRNQIRVALCHQGLECKSKDLTGKAALEAVPALIQQLPECARLVATEVWQLLLAVEQSLAVVDRRIEQGVAQDPVARELCQHEGLGPVTVWGMMAEIGEIVRFARDKRLISYAGSAPRTFQTGDFHATGSLPERCNKRLRHWVFLATQGAVRSKKPSKAKETYERVKQRHDANAAKTAASRDILRFVYWTWTYALRGQAQAQTQVQAATA